MLNDSELHKPMLGFVAWYCLTVEKEKKNALLKVSKHAKTCQRHTCLNIKLENKLRVCIKKSAKERKPVMR